MKIDKRTIAQAKDSPILRRHLLHALAGNKAYEKSVSAYTRLLSKIRQKAIEKAFLFALEKHEGQSYAWNRKKLPYSYHISKAGFNALSLSSNKEAHIIALWHDIIEDKRAKEGHIAQELKNNAYKGILPSSLISSLLLLDKNNSASIKEYYAGICKDKNALIAKTADIMANLDACIEQFNCMIRAGRRFWIYDYLIEIPVFLLESKELNASSFRQRTKKEIQPRISRLLSLLPEKNLEEFRQYKKGANNGKQLD